MSWIKVRTNLHEDPRVIMVAAELGVDELHAVGMLWRAWAWADSQSLDGDELKVTDAFLDRLVRRDGFSAALRKVGWLEGRQGALSFPRFAEHNGQTAKGRALNQQRVANHRARTGITDGVTSVTHGALPEERRGEKKESAARAPAREPTEPPTKPEYAEDWRVSDAKRYPLPAGFDTPEIRAGWVSWIEYLVGRFGPGAVSTPTLQQHIAKLKECSPSSAVEALRNAASKNFREPCPPLPSRTAQGFRPPPAPAKKACND